MRRPYSIGRPSRAQHIAIARLWFGARAYRLAYAVQGEQGIAHTAQRPNYVRALAFPDKTGPTLHVFDVNFGNVSVLTKLLRILHVFFAEHGCFLALSGVITALVLHGSPALARWRHRAWSDFARRGRNARVSHDVGLLHSQGQGRFWVVATVTKAIPLSKETVQWQGANVVVHGQPSASEARHALGGNNTSTAHAKLRFAVNPHS